MSGAIKILFLAAEAEPFVKIGGLADVAGSLPLALRDLPSKGVGDVNLDVRLVIPLHRDNQVEEKSLRLATEFAIYRRGGNIPVNVLELISGGLPVYFIKSDLLSKTSSVYSTDPALDREKYTLFPLAALELIRHMEWVPDIVHANDWHTALALYALRTNGSNPELAGVKTIITIHNLAYMGGDGSDVLPAYGLLPLNNDSLPEWARNQPLPLGLWSADTIVAVSPTYAQEILTPGFSCGLETFFSSRPDHVIGILNGLDIKSWNPQADKALPANFDLEHLPARAANRTALQSTLGLTLESKAPILAMIGRIDYQKGPDIAFEVIRRMADQYWQFVILGSGNPELENEARTLEMDFPGHVRAVIRYDEDLARLIYGGADIFLMPSRYEPCGLAQMIAMRYGCVPLVHATGGLKDTVYEGKTGFLFQDDSSESMKETLVRALAIYATPDRWQQFQRNGMKEDFSWSRSARLYANIYQTLTSGS
jgi:starch synthase